jgi:hypothetical protein
LVDVDVSVVESDARECELCGSGDPYFPWSREPLQSIEASVEDGLDLELVVGRDDGRGETVDGERLLVLLMV